MRSTSRLHVAALALPLAVFLSACGAKVDPVEVEQPVATAPASTPAGGGATATAGTSDAGGTTSGSGSTSTGGTSTGGTTTPGLCGTSAATIGYSLNAAAVINANCTSCHSPTGSQSDKPLDNFADAKSTFMAFNGKYQVDSGAMPTTGPLDANDTCIIDAWVNGSYQP